MYSINQIKNYATILKSGKDTFWASDFGFRGGDINGLKRDFIDLTGNTKESLVDLGGGLYKKVEVQEWRVRRFNDVARQTLWRRIVYIDFKKDIEQLIAVADLLREMGY